MKTLTHLRSGYTTVPKKSIIPRFLFFLLIISLASSVSPLGWITADYGTIKAQMPHPAQLQERNEHKQSMYVPLEKHISRMVHKFIEFQALDHELNVIPNSKQNKSSIRFRGVGASQPTLSPLAHSKIGTGRESIPLMDKTLDALQNKVALFKTEKFNRHGLRKNRRMLLAAIPSISPTRGQISSGFGYRVSSFSREKAFHEGIDIATEINTPIVAPADGIVSAISRDRRSGKTLRVNHGYGIETIYAHLQKIIVRKGRHVKRRDMVALVGNTGRSTGPHLHYKILLRGVPVDPLNYMPDEARYTGSTHLKPYPYSLHLGSFQTLDRAKRAVSIYTKKGLSPYWTIVDLKEKGVWYRIFAGYFSDKTQAERFKEKYRLAEARVKKTAYANLAGTYESYDELGEIVPTLEDLGYSPYLIRGDRGRSRLLVGAFYSKTAAERKCLELRAKGFPIQVVRR